MYSQSFFREIIQNLLFNTATAYPVTYLDKLFSALSAESEPAAKGVLTSIIDNILSSVEESSSLCQDTGIPTFHIYSDPQHFPDFDVHEVIVQATREATSRIPLRKNVIDPLSLENSQDNTGWGTPFVYFHYTPQSDHMKIRAELKGFGGEIKSNTDWIFTSTESTEEAVLAYVLNTVLLSRGENCIPGFIGLGLGGYLAEAMANAKNSVFRELNGPEQNPDEALSRLENRIYQCVNSLGLGPMGKGGEISSLGIYLEKRGTHTAAAPIAVSQQCWASRASEVILDAGTAEYLTPHVQTRHIPDYRKKLNQELSQVQAQKEARVLHLPVDSAELGRLQAGDIVYLEGILCTARDRAHQRMAALVREGRSGDIPQEILANGAVYHCGPVVSQIHSKWTVRAAGPTTSSRFTSDAAFLIDHGMIQVSIGKGTMGPAAQKAMRGRGIYLNAVGGCAVTYKNLIEFKEVKWLDLGPPEAVWIFRVHHFGPLLVAIDAQGNQLMKNILENVHRNALLIYEQENLNPAQRYIQYPQTLAGLSLNEVIALNT